MTEHFGGRAKRGSDGRVRYLAKVNLGLKMASKNLNHLIYEGYFEVTYHKGSINLSFSYLCHMTILIHTKVEEKTQTSSIDSNVEK